MADTGCRRNAVAQREPTQRMEEPKCKILRAIAIIHPLDTWKMCMGIVERSCSTQDREVIAAQYSYKGHEHI